MNTLAKGVDYGFDYAPGASLSSDFIANKAASLPQPLKSAFLNDVNKVSDAKIGLLSSSQPSLAMTPIAPYRQPWQDNFPAVILNAGLGEASKHPYYTAAKAGDLEAAVMLVKD